jgi:hypothetical protein
MRHRGRWLLTSIVTFNLMGFGLAGCDSSSNPEGMPKGEIKEIPQSDMDRLKKSTVPPKKKQ